MLSVSVFIPMVCPENSEMKLSLSLSLSLSQPLQCLVALLGLSPMFVLSANCVPFDLCTELSRPIDGMIHPTINFLVFGVSFKAPL